MRIGILGTGAVGIALGTALIKKGHSIMIGSRSGDNPQVKEWVLANENGAYQGNFSQAAAFGELLFNCTMGAFSIDALIMAGLENFKYKILLDIANPLDFSKGMPPILTICNTSSLGEEIQGMLPDTKVVKALNTVTVELMVEPTLLNDGNHDVLLCGDDDVAKRTITDLLVNDLGWKNECIIDLGGIIHARSTEGLLPFAFSMAIKTGKFINNIKNYSV